ncbi:MAG: hypothetical protein IPJ16_00320 [Bacteroidales bacterium]|nr:hypothetical protein [Bacteroidales bacterium]
MQKYVTISITPKSKIIIDRLADKFEMSQKDFAEAMAKYFDTTGVNPKDLQVLSPAEELKKFRDTIISFMRKQENDFIKPTFGKMDTLIARFVTYIEEEAPRKGDASGQTKVKSFPISNENVKDEKTVPLISENLKIDQQSEEYKLLQEKLNKVELKLKTTKGYLENILSHTEEKSTGLNRKPVIELPIGDINEYRKYLKTL